MYVNTNSYEWSHGKKPRGYGGWAFAFTRYPEPEHLDGLFWFNGTYSEAKKAALAEARSRGVNTVTVMP